MKLPKHITRHNSYYTTTTLLGNKPKTTHKIVYFCHHCTQFLTDPETYAKHSTTCIQRREV